MLFVGPEGSGTTTLIEAIADRLQLTGTACVSGTTAELIDRPPDGVAIVDRLGVVDSAKAVLSLMRTGWRVLAATDGPGLGVDDAFAALARAGKVTLIELPALERAVRELVLRRELPMAERGTVELLARCGPGDGVALAILAARTIARAGLAGGPVDVDAAATAVRGRRDVPPVPTRVDELVSVVSTVMPRNIAASFAAHLRPLAATGPLADPIAEVAAGAPVAIAGGASLAVAHRAALHHALAGRSVLFLTARQRAVHVADQLVELCGGSGRADGVAAAIVAGLPIAVLADPARSLVDVPSIVRRCRPYVGFEPEVVVVDAHTLDDLDGIATPAVVVADRGAAGAGWDVDDGRPHVAVRRAGGAWVRVASPSGESVDRNGLATDDTGAIRAWRLWSLIIDADGVALGSPVRTTVWPRGVITSTCGRCRSKPQSTCSCGIYAFTDPSRALAAWRGSPHLVFGELRCWGRIVRHDDGVRAEFAQPVQLHLGTIGSEVERRTLSARYGCDVTGR